MEQSSLYKIFQAACRMSHRIDTCTTHNARIKVRAALGRVWSMQQVLPAGDIELDAEGTPRIQRTYHLSLQDQLTQLEAAIIDATMVRGFPAT
jgi:hypothetical protein